MVLLADSSVDDTACCGLIADRICFLASVTPKRPVEIKRQERGFLAPRRFLSRPQKQKDRQLVEQFRASS